MKWKEISQWEGKLNTVSAILDSMADVQHRWVYLERVFRGDDAVGLIRMDSRSGYQEFKTFDLAFRLLMGRIKMNPRVAFWAAP